MLKNFRVVYLGLSPCPVTVTTRIAIFLVGDPYKSSFATVTGRGGQPNVYPRCSMHSGQFIVTSHEFLGPQKVAVWKKSPAISGKSRLVKDYILPRCMEYVTMYKPLIPKKIWDQCVGKSSSFMEHLCSNRGFKRLVTDCPRGLEPLPSREPHREEMQ